MDNKLTLKQQVLFFELLASFLKAGFSIQQAIVQMGVLAPNLQQVLQVMKKKLQQGAEFSCVLKPYINENLYYQILIAEQYGNIDECITELGRLLKLRLQQRNKLKSLLIYPVCLLIFLIFLIGVVKIFVLPQIITFNQVQQSFLGSHNKMILWGIVVLLIVFLSGYIIWRLKWLREQNVLAKHQWYSTLPLVGKLYQIYCHYYLTYNLGMLLKSGMELQAICYCCQHYQPTSLLYQLGISLPKIILNGEKLADFVDKYRFIPSELILFINKGQTLNELSRELLLYSELSYEKLLKESNRLLNLIQPILFGVIGLLIIGTYLVIFGPLYRDLGGVLS
ncbi:comg operon protein 2 [Ligilactobacillus ceti DSM 22408]|uniref:Comg operon protein 2 n=2 Tax=Ligilactobacillus TaxID=2767887 RepID=A0A0R2KKQ7_9LACO|nr:competence type IV pilus assembly protein ComGB [Ligilactobacillus ceti]KRN89968.1 comg operon protein 2 [Ligilactobacillus ceti DSM 22408]